MGRFNALLRGINVGGHRKVPMAGLRSLAEAEGLENPRTYVASGNLVFESGKSAAALETALERAIERQFGFAVDVVVRTAAQWKAYRDGCPMRDAAEAEPSRVMIVIGKQPAGEAHLAALRERASPNERVEQAGDAIWIHFGDGAGRSRIGAGPAKGIWTVRNWRTVETIQEMLES